MVRGTPELEPASTQHKSAPSCDVHPDFLTRRRVSKNRTDSDFGLNIISANRLHIREHKLSKKVYLALNLTEKVLIMLYEKVTPHRRLRLDVDQIYDIQVSISWTPGLFTSLNHSNYIES